jgi:hypothetical protein
LATVYHGLPRGLHKFQNRSDNYLAFLGRISPEKRLDRAIDIVAEYFRFHGQTITNIGLGSIISRATDTGNFPCCLRNVCDGFDGCHSSIDCFGGDCTPWLRGGSA